MAGAGWLAPGEGVPEPNTVFDEPRYNFAGPNTAPRERVSFNAFLGVYGLGGLPAADVAGDSRIQPGVLPRWYAMLGYWRDCNRDGFVGDAATGRLEYEALFLGAGDVCPEGSPYNVGGEVHEFRWIGPRAGEEQPVSPEAGGLGLVLGDRRDVTDAGAKVWGDRGLPSDPYDGYVLQVLPLPRGTLDTFGDHLEFADLVTRRELSRTFDLAVGPGAFDSAARDLRAEPSPLAVARDRYNDSEADRGGGAHGTPLLRVWDCDAPREGPGGATPGVQPQVFLERGSLDPTVAEATRPRLPDPVKGAAGGDCKATGTHLPYANLEGTGTPQTYDGRKRSVDYSMGFSRGLRFRDSATGALDRGDAVLGVPAAVGGVLPASDGPVWAGPIYFTATGIQRPPWSLVPSGVLSTEHATFYADVTVPGGGELPSGSDAFVYGSENCAGATPITGDWDCDPAGWSPGRVRVGDAYDVRDTDCLDDTIAGGARPRPPRALAPHAIDEACA